MHLAAGTYYWQASYSGDSTNAASTSTCGSEVETVTSATTTEPTSLAPVGQRVRSAGTSPLDRVHLGPHRHRGDRFGHAGRDQCGPSPVAR